MNEDLYSSCLCLRLSVYGCVWMIPDLLSAVGSFVSYDLYVLYMIYDQLLLGGTGGYGNIRNSDSNYPFKE